MLAFVVKLTHEAYRMTPEDTQALRDAGFSDTTILQITIIAAWFNYINRVADALGVGKTGTVADPAKVVSFSP